MKMPYVVGPPVRLSADFFGRERQTHQFFETLAGGQLQCVSIQGLRRAGKTSFLQHVANPEVMAAFLPDPQRYLMLYVDISSCRTAADFYGRVYQKLLAGLQQPSDGSRRVLPAADVYAVESLLYDYGDRRIVWLMDEFDQLRTADFGGEFMTELRALAGIWDFELAYVTASYWDLYRLGNFVGLPPTSPFYNIFFPTPIFLSGLSPAELEDLVRVPARRVGIEADDADVAFVRHHAGTLPFFVQAVAAIWLTNKAQGRLPDSRAVIRQLVSEMGPYYEQWWRNFSDVERDVVVAVAQERQVSRLPYAESEIARAVERLRNYGVVAEAGGQLWLESAILAHWVQENAGKTDRPGHAISPNGGLSPARQTDSSALRPDDIDLERLVQILEDTGRRLETSAREAHHTEGGAMRDIFAQAIRDAGGPFRSDPPTPGLVLATMGSSNIVARAAGRNVFVADCFTWEGQKELLRRVDLLLGQLSARRTRATAIILVRNREYSLVIDAAQRAMPHHACFLGFDGRRSPVRLDYRFHLNGDPHGEIRLSVLLFHLPD